LDIKLWRLTNIAAPFHRLFGTARLLEKMIRLAPTIKRWNKPGSQERIPMSVADMWIALLPTWHFFGWPPKQPRPVELMMINRLL
jgi:hypothetical protein